MKKFRDVNRKIEKAVISGYKTIEKTVVNSYKAIENGVVNSYKKIEKKFIEAFLTDDSDQYEPRKAEIQTEES